MTASPTDSIVGASSDKKEELSEMSKFDRIRPIIALILSLVLFYNTGILIWIWRTVMKMEGYPLPRVTFWASVVASLIGLLGIVVSLLSKDHVQSVHSK